MGWIQNMWRGYTDADRRSLEKKLAEPHELGAVITLTRAEYNCWRRSDYDCRPPLMDVADERHLQSGNDPW